MHELETELPSLLNAIGRSLLMGTLTLVLVGGICRVGERFLSANLRCFLWRLSYIKLLLGLVGVAWFVRLPIAIPTPKTPTFVAPPSALAPAPIPIAADATPHTAPITFPTATIQQMPAVAAPVQSAATPTPSHINFARLVLPALAGPYLVGLLICIARLIFSLRRMQRVLRTSALVADADAIAALQSLAQRLGLRHVPALRQSSDVSSPFCTTGTIVLPTDLVGTPEVPTILAHELAHARRRDLAWEWLGTLTQMLLFFHPLVLLARREERIARESAADALALTVTGTPPADYSRMLLALALKPRPFAAVGAIGVLGGTGLRRRLLALHQAAVTPSTRRPVWTHGIEAVLVLAAATPLSIATARNASKEPPAKADASPSTTTKSAHPLGDSQIEGLVLATNHLPIAGMKVIATRDSNFQVKYDYEVVPTAVTFTTHEGRFSLPALPEGRYSISVVSPEHQHASFLRWGIVLNKHETRNFQWTAPAHATITGIITDKKTHAPLRGDYVWANPAAYKGPWKPTRTAADDCPGIDQAITDENGRYTLCIAAGPTYVYGGGYDDSQNKQSLDRHLRLAPGSVTPLNFADVSASQFPTSANNSVTVAAQPIPPSALIPATDAHMPVPTKRTRISASDYFAPEGTERMLGVVQDEKGTPIPGASVSMFYGPLNQLRNYKPVQQSSRTDSSGRFHFDRLTPGIYQLGVFSGKHRFPTGGATNITLVAGAKETPVVVTMRHGILIQGRVTSRRTGTPLQGVVLTSANLAALAEYHKPSKEISMSTIAMSESDFAVSDANGRYQLCVPNGDSYLEVGESMTNNGPRIRNPQTRKLHNPQGAALTQDFTVDVPPTLKFVGEDGKPLANVSVWLSPDPKSHKSSHIEATDTNGSVALSDFNGDIDNGSFSATSADLRISGAFQSGPNGLLSVTVGKTTQTFPTGNGIVSMTHPSSAFLLGRVVDPQGKPLPQAVLALYSSELHSVYGLPALHYHPDAQGRFRLPLALTQRYALSVRADGFNAVDAITYISLTPYAGMQKDVGTVTLLPAPGSISGQIVDEHGKPVAQAILAVRGGQTNASYAITDSQGSFKIPNVVPGELLRLEVCQHGMVTDGEYGFQSSKSWYRTGVRAGMPPLYISLRPEQVSQTLPIESHP